MTCLSAGAWDLLLACIRGRSPMHRSNTVFLAPCPKSQPESPGQSQYITNTEQASPESYHSNRHTGHPHPGTISRKEHARRHKRASRTLSSGNKKQAHELTCSQPRQVVKSNNALIRRGQRPCQDQVRTTALLTLVRVFYRLSTGFFLQVRPEDSTYLAQPKS